MSGILCVRDSLIEKPVLIPPVGPDAINPIFPPILKLIPLVKLDDPTLVWGLQSFALSELWTSPSPEVIVQYLKYGPAYFPLSH